MERERERGREGERDGGGEGERDGGRGGWRERGMEGERDGGRRKDCSLVTVCEVKCPLDFHAVSQFV